MCGCVQRVIARVGQEEQTDLKVHKAFRKQINEESQGARTKRVGYVVQALKPVHATRDEMSWTSTKDGYYPAVAARFALFVLMMLCDMLPCNTEEH